MRRFALTLVILAVAVSSLVGCCGACGPCEIQQPNGTYTTVVDENCYAVNRYGHPFP